MPGQQNPNTNDVMQHATYTRINFHVSSFVRCRRTNYMRWEHKLSFDRLYILKLLLKLLKSDNARSKYILKCRCHF